MLCDACFQEFPEFQTAVKNEAGITVLLEESHKQCPKTHLATSLFEEKEEALKALRVTAAFLMLDTVAGVRYIKHKIYNGNYVSFVWQATGTAYDSSISEP
ncbi:hypothetical protein [Phosphitispora fastidiosa]|uniref:hypothetical protein n=1 Tax=Phosphitispora fastidiosa TaxID=2837202 RepID=UPI001E52E70D|nr:hypothetical protein [Phosphitispora fastidiosa]MBU7007166.1 hypothetical protein [Phosphitispora fastidiosa]